MDPAFEECRFPAAVGLVEIGNPGVPCSAIVAGEDDQCILVEPGVLELLENIADAPIELRIMAP